MLRGESKFAERNMDVNVWPPSPFPSSSYHIFHLVYWLRLRKMGFLTFTGLTPHLLNVHFALSVSTFEFWPSPKEAMRRILKKRVFAYFLVRYNRIWYCELRTTYRTQKSSSSVGLWKIRYVFLFQKPIIMIERKRPNFSITRQRFMIFEFCKKVLTTHISHNKISENNRNWFFVQKGRIAPLNPLIVFSKSVFFVIIS